MTKVSKSVNTPGISCSKTTRAVALKNHFFLFLYSGWFYSFKSSHHLGHQRLVLGNQSKKKKSMVGFFSFKKEYEMEILDDVPT